MSLGSSLVKTNQTASVWDVSSNSSGHAAPAVLAASTCVQTTIMEELRRQMTKEELTCSERKGCNAFTGWIIAAFPFAQLIFAPGIGHFGSSKGVKPVLGLTLGVMALGYVMYSLARDRWILLIARFVIGCGAGNVTVLRHYAVAATTPANRTELMAKMSGVQVHYLLFHEITSMCHAVLLDCSYGVHVLCCF